VGRAQHHPRAGKSRGLLASRLGDPCQTQVQNLDHAPRIHQQVAGLDVPVDHALAVRIFQPPSRLDDEVEGTLWRQRALLLDQMV